MDCGWRVLIRLSMTGRVGRTGVEAWVFVDTDVANGWVHLRNAAVEAYCASAACTDCAIASVGSFVAAGALASKRFATLNLFLLFCVVPHAGNM